MTRNQTVPSYRGERNFQQTPEIAQSRSSYGYYPDNRYGLIAEGFRAGLKAVSLNGEIEYNTFLGNGSAGGDVDHDFGLELGYGSVNSSSAGYITKLVLSQMCEDVRALRFELNGTIGVSDSSYVLAGINLNSFTSGLESFDSGMGVQLGKGLAPLP